MEETIARRNWLAAIGVTGLGVLATGALRLRRDGASVRGWADALPARALMQQRHFPNVPLVTHDGKAVRFYKDLLKDKKVVLTFIDTMILAESTKVVENLAKLQQFFGSRVGKDMFMYTMTINPKQDTPAVLKNWATRYGAGAGWLFLTGKPDNIERLRSGLGLNSEYPEDQGNPRYPIGVLRTGIEPEMRWAHHQAEATTRVLAHHIQLDFGTDPQDPNPPPLWNCERLIAKLS